MHILLFVARVEKEEKMGQKEEMILLFGRRMVRGRCTCTIEGFK